MSKTTIYEEALADARQVKEVATAAAINTLVEAVKPKIRALIEQQLTAEIADEEVEEDEKALGAPGATAPTGELMTDQIIEPKEEVLDINPVSSHDNNAKQVITIVSSNEEDPLYIEFNKDISSFSESINKSSKACKLIKESVGYKSYISKLAQKAEDMYEWLQESTINKDKKEICENKLETCFSEIKRLQETMMKKRLTEEDVQLKITGLPDDLDLDAIGIDLITDEVEEDSSQQDAQQVQEEVPEETSTEDDSLLADEDEVGEEAPVEEEEEQVAEATEEDLDDDTVVEIDESMLRREVARMKKLLESKEEENLNDEELTKEVAEQLDVVDEVEQATSCMESKKRSLQKRIAESHASAKLREKLLEANLCNVKLTLANKILQSESLNKTQKSRIVTRLNESKTSSEAQKVYDSVVRALKNKKVVSEAKVTAGASSAPTKSGKATINEGYETARWQKLAGLIK